MNHVIDAGHAPQRLFSQTRHAHGQPQPIRWVTLLCTLVTALAISYGYTAWAIPVTPCSSACSNNHKKINAYYAVTKSRINLRKARYMLRDFNKNNPSYTITEESIKNFQKETLVDIKKKLAEVKKNTAKTI